jgi:hypothetical protein
MDRVLRQGVQLNTHRNRSARFARRMAGGLLAIVLVLGGLLPLSVAHAQDDGPLNVAFIVDRGLNASSVADNGPDGISRLGQLFRAQGAVTQIIRLSDPVPPEVDVIVLVGPSRSISSEYLGRLWTHIVNNGAHLLVAIDPSGHDDRGTDRADGGLSTLLGTDYGVSLEDTFLVEPWFTQDSAAGLESNFLFASVDPYITHPVSEPLRTYDVPVLMWGARSIDVEAFGLYSEASTLLQTAIPYGETELPDIDRGREPWEFTLDEDVLGRQSVVAVGQYVADGSRIAVLGDSEMLQNGYGLALTGSGLPRFPGNRLLAERLIAWLLERPEADWPPLSNGVTWLGVDGDPADWARTLPAVLTDGAGDADPAVDIQQVRGFRNNDYLYLLLETAAPPPADVQVLIGADATFNGQSDIRLAGQGGAVRVLDEAGATVIDLPDATTATGAALEVRVPLRTLGAGLRFQISELCLFAADDADLLGDAAAPLDCLGQPLAVTSVAQNDVFNLRFPDAGLLVTVQAPNGGNLRRAPDTTSTVLGVLFFGDVLDAVGRDVTGEWIEVRSARYAGWMASFLLVANGDVMALPVTAAPVDSP